MKGKNNKLSFISNEESRLINMIELNRFLDSAGLSEREHLIAEELFQKDMIRKVNKNGKTGYKTFSTPV